MTDLELNGDELAILEDVCATAMRAGATTLSILLNQQVTVSSPTAQVLDADAVSRFLQEPSVMVEMPMTVGQPATSAFFFGQADTARITDLMMGGEGSPPDTEIDDLRLSAISEAVNQMMGMASNALTTTYGTKVEVSPPQASVVDSPDALTLPADLGDGPFAVVTYLFAIEGLVESQISQLMPLPASRNLIELARSKQGRAQPAPAPAATSPGADLLASIPQVAPPHAPPPSMPPDLGPSVPYGIPQAPVAPPPLPPPPQREIVAQSVQFGPLGAPVGPAPLAAASGLDLIMDVPLRVTVELGRTRMQIRDVLELGKGSVVELDKLAGEPVDLLVNGKLIARGEVVVIDENFGIRVTDIVSPAERVTGFRGIGLS